MNYPLFFILAAIILSACLIIGRKASLGIKNETDYFLSGRKLTFFSVAMTILATQLGGGAIIGAAEAAYNYGWVAIAYSAGLALGLVILSFGIGAKFRKMEISTLPEIFKKNYNSEFLRIFSSLIYIVSLFFVLIAIGVSARKFALAVGFNNEIIFIIFWLIIIIYTATGGLTAVTRTDILQIIFVLTAFFITFIFLMKSDIPYITTQPTSPRGEVSLLSWLALPCLFAIIGQDMAQRCFAAKSPKAISYASLLAAIVLVIASLLPVYLGILASQIGSEPVKGSSILINIVSQVTNPYVASIFSCAILMAILSTADSLLCAVSSNVALDFHFIRSKNLANAKLSKIITVVIGLGAMISSYFAEEVIPTMLIAYEISVCTLFVPIIMAVILKSPARLSAYFSCISGLGTYIILLIANYQYKELVAVAVSFAAFAIGEMLARIKARA